MAMPPRLLEWLLARVLDARDREWVLGDLAEEYARVAAERGRRRATVWYLMQVIGAIGPSGKRRLDRAPAYSNSTKAGPMNSLTRASDAIRLDLRIAFRHVLRTPFFTLGSALSLGLGLGLAVAIFSVVNGVLLRPLPYRQPDKLLWIWSNLESIGVPRANTNGPQLIMLRERARMFEGFALLDGSRTPVTGPNGEDPQQLDVTVATANLFDLLGVRAALGRTFLPGEDGPAGARVAVLSWGVWQQRYGGDPKIIGQQILLDGNPNTIVGVMPRDFRFVNHQSLGAPSNVDLWAPLREDLPAGQRGSFSYSMLARMASNVSESAAVAELQAIAAKMGVEWGWVKETDPPFQFRPVGLVRDLVGGIRSALLILQAAVLLLLICVVASQAALLLARADQRMREVTIARALGAGKGALMRPVVAESIMLALLGGVLGVTTAVVSLPYFLKLVPASLPRRGDIAVDWWVLGIAFGTTLLVGFCAGVFPAFRSARRDLIVSLREVGVVAGRPASRRLRSGLVVAQLALSFVLVSGAALLARSMENLLAIQPGFATRGALTFEVQLPGSRYAEISDILSFAARVRERLGALPGVRNVGITSGLPLSTRADQAPAHFFGSSLRERDPEAARLLVDFLAASPGYFEAMGIRILEGRDFLPGDVADAPTVAIIDRTVAERHFPDGNAVGQRFSIFGDSTVRVVGVVEQARLYRVDENGRGQVWAPLGQSPRRRMFFALSIAGNTRTVGRDVLRAMRTIDPVLPVSNVFTIEALLADSVSERRLAFMLISAFGLVSILLAVLGTYTLVASGVAQRTREIGIRMAIGARQSQVASMVLGNATRLIFVGAAVGLVLALAASRALRSLLYGIAPTDARTYVVTLLILGVAALLSAALPALRAARVQPASTLREE